MEKIEINQELLGVFLSLFYRRRWRMWRRLRVSVHLVALVFSTLVSTKARGECQRVGLSPSTTKLCLIYFRPHRMHEMLTIATVNCGVCVSVSLRITRLLCCANMVERITVLLGLETLEDSRNVALDGTSRFPPTDSMRPSPNYFFHLL